MALKGTARLQGIAKNWSWAGSPEAAHLVDELCTAPANPNTTTGTMITTGLIGLHSCSVQSLACRCGQCSRTLPLVVQLRLAGAGFGYLAYKRPRLAMFAGGLVAFTTLPYVSATATC